jgi:hypothetical protein
MKAMKHILAYCLATLNRGAVLKPTRKWDGDPDFKFKISGKADSSYATEPDTRRSVDGHATFLEEACICKRSRMQKNVALAVSTAELHSAVECAQDMLFAMKVVESIGLEVEKPMILEIDNKGAKDNGHNWSVGGRNRHVEIWQNFLHELNEENILIMKWVPGKMNCVDLFTKNLGGPLFEKHTRVFVGTDEYMSPGCSQGEGVGRNDSGCEVPGSTVMSAGVSDPAVEEKKGRG